MRARKLYAYGDQRDYFDKKHCIGKHPSSDLDWHTKSMQVLCATEIIISQMVLRVLLATGEPHISACTWGLATQERNGLI